MPSERRCPDPLDVAILSSLFYNVTSALCVLLVFLMYQLGLGKTQSIVLYILASLECA